MSNATAMRRSSVTEQLRTGHPALTAPRHPGTAPPHRVKSLSRRNLSVRLREPRNPPPLSLHSNSSYSGATPCLTQAANAGRQPGGHECQQQSQQVPVPPPLPRRNSVCPPHVPALSLGVFVGHQSHTPGRLCGFSTTCLLHPCAPGSRVKIS